jgi:hypothetical protein
MTRFSYRGLQVYVGEMSRATALQFSRDAGQISLIAEPDYLAHEVDYLIVSHAPCKITHAGTILSAGTHAIELEDGSAIALTIPITRECFDALPASLALEWAQAATDENKIVTDFFLQALRRVVLNFSEPTSANVPS